MIEFIFGSNPMIMILGILVISLIVGFVIDLIIDGKFNVLVWIGCSSCVMFVLIYLVTLGSIED